ncbi:hypothetical protein U1Q18_025118 [Sarracenia purpurea var. burkii]
MAAIRVLLRSQTLNLYLSHSFRALSTSTTTAAVADAAAAAERSNHQFLPPSKFLNSWKPPKDPKEAEAKLARLRREYAKKVKNVRKEYIKEMELQRLEKQRKDEAKRETIRIANEERKAAKAATKRAKAAERKVTDEEFRKTLLKERTEKLEYWRMKEKLVKEKKKDKNELVRRQSSVWIEEADLEKKLLEVIVDTIHL